VKIEILGGEKEIGGNKILVEHKGTRILLDFGMSFGQAGKYFSEFLQPRKGAALTDFFELGLLPDKKGFYRQDYLDHMDRPKEEREVDAVFLSHAHADHAQYIHFLRLDLYYRKDTFPSWFSYPQKSLFARKAPSSKNQRLFTFLSSI